MGNALPRTACRCGGRGWKIL